MDGQQEQTTHSSKEITSSSHAVKKGGEGKKSSLAYRTISEVATDLDVAAHVLRFWETKFTQITPLKRGGGRRYYRPEDVDLIRKIKTLLYDEGYTIRGVQAYLNNSDTAGRTTINGAQQGAKGAANTANVVAELRQIRAILDT